MKFIIRDDDLNYFSKPSDIERWYSDIFSKNIPVGFAAIPFVRKDSDVYVGAGSSGQEYPISGNLELVNYVKQNKNIEILQHGCFHENTNGVFEYAKSGGLFEPTQKGKAELEKAFGSSVGIFVPPHDWISAHGILAIEDSQMDIIRGRGAGLRNFIWRKEYLKNFFKMLFFRFPNYISVKARVYSCVFGFGGHREMCSYRLEDPDIFAGLDYVNKRDGVFVVVCHLHYFDEKKKNRLNDLIAKARAFGAQFSLPGEIFKT